MNQRIIFQPKSSRDQFFNKVLEKSSEKTWKSVYENNNLNRTVFDRYRNGILSIPSPVYNSLMRNFDTQEITSFSGSIELREENWGQVLGGKITYAGYHQNFEIGRKKGILKILRNKHLYYRSLFDVENVKLDLSLAHLTGLLLGDGFTNQYSSHYLTQFIGHKKYELEYYQAICEYLKATFNLKPRMKISTEKNFLRVNIYSKDLFLLLTRKCGVPTGRKSHTVVIPEVILSSSKEILFSCIAGIYDAEGCSFIDRRKMYREPYPRLDLHMRSLHMLNQIKNILDKEGITTSYSCINTKNSRVLIYGETDIKRFLQIIPIKNPKVLNKLKVYQ